MQINDYVDFQPPFANSTEELKLRSKSWPCKILYASSNLIELKGDMA